MPKKRKKVSVGKVTSRDRQFFKLGQDYSDAYARFSNSCSDAGMTLALASIQERCRKDLVQRSRELRTHLDGMIKGYRVIIKLVENAPGILSSEDILNMRDKYNSAIRSMNSKENEFPYCQEVLARALNYSPPLAKRLVDLAGKI